MAHIELEFAPREEEDRSSSVYVSRQEQSMAFVLRLSLGFSGRQQVIVIFVFPDMLYMKKVFTETNGRRPIGQQSGTKSGRRTADGPLINRSSTARCRQFALGPLLRPVSGLQAALTMFWHKVYQ